MTKIELQVGTCLKGAPLSLNRGRTGIIERIHGETGACTIKWTSSYNTFSDTWEKSAVNFCLNRKLWVPFLDVNKIWKDLNEA